MMSTEEKQYIAKIIRRETGCGLMDAKNAIEALIKSLKHQPMIVMDNPRKLKVTVEYE